MKLSEVAKAIISAATALGGTYTVAASDGHITVTEIVGIVIATVIAFWGVWATTNEITMEQVLKQFSADQIKQLYLTSTK